MLFLFQIQNDRKDHKQQKCNSDQHTDLQKAIGGQQYRAKAQQRGNAIQNCNRLPLGKAQRDQLMMQVGFIGLIKAIDRFDPSYDVMFSTYAVPLILGELRRYVRDDGKIKVDRRTKQEIRRMRVLVEDYCSREGKSPHIHQLAEWMEVDQERVLYLMEAQEAMFGMESLDDPEGTVGRTAGDHPEYQMVEQLDLKAAIASLSEREQKVLLLRYFRDMTQQQIAKCLGMTQVQVSRMEKKIMCKLRSEMKENA